MTSKGKSINLFLMDGTAAGRVKCTLANWNGVAYRIPRTEIDKCKDRQDHQGQSAKRFDFVVKTASCVYAIETNFYSSGGSKLNETARSYKMLAEESSGINGFKFVWLTDGTGWTSAKGNLKETFDVLPTIYNIAELETGVLNEVFV